MARVQFLILGLFNLIVLINCLPFYPPKSIQIYENQIQSRQKRSPRLFDDGILTRDYVKSIDGIYLTTSRPKLEAIDMTTSGSYIQRGDNFREDFGDMLNPPVDPLPNIKNYSLMNFVTTQIQRLPGMIFNAINMWAEMKSPFEDEAFAKVPRTINEMAGYESLEFFRRRPQLTSIVY